MSNKKRSFVRFFPNSPPQVIGDPHLATLIRENNVKDFNWDSYNPDDNDRVEISKKRDAVETEIEEE